MIRGVLLLLTMPILLAATFQSLGAQANQSLGAEANRGRTGRLDVGVYAGAVYHSDWFVNANSARSSWSPGTSGAVGVTASYRLSPSFGIRAHGLFGRTSLPTDDPASGSDPTVVTEVYAMDGFWWPPLPKRFGKPYVFAGAGVHTTRITGGDSRQSCTPVTEGAAGGGCLSRDRSSTGQGSVGVGMDLVHTGPVTVFSEAAVHGFNSPVHVPGQAGEDRFVAMPRVVVGAKVRLL